LFISIGTEIYGENYYTFILFENVLVGVFAIVGGFICDTVGRKRLSITGFVILGLGYAILGVFPLNTLSWYIYFVIDGVAWGMLYVVFLFTVWGDLSFDKPSEKYYALASLPYILSNFLRFTFGPIIAAALSVYAIFSFAAFFLFLAVIPLMFAPETLPEKTLRERELRSYIEKAKRVREKFTKG
jgi:MFS family permease